MIRFPFPNSLTIFSHPHKIVWRTRTSIFYIKNRYLQIIPHLNQKQAWWKKMKNVCRCLLTIFIFFLSKHLKFTCNFNEVMLLKCMVSFSLFPHSFYSWINSECEESLGFWVGIFGIFPSGAFEEIKISLYLLLCIFYNFLLSSSSMRELEKR